MYGGVNDSGGRRPSAYTGLNAFPVICMFDDIYLSAKGGKGDAPKVFPDKTKLGSLSLKFNFELFYRGGGVESKSIE